MKYKLRRLVVAIIMLVGLAYVYVAEQPADTSPPPVINSAAKPTGDAAATLEQLAVKGRAPNTGYARSQFGDGWTSMDGCDTRNIILNRDLTGVKASECKVMRGVLDDPYTGKRIEFQRGGNTSALVQIDHVVALSDAWQKGAQQLTYEQRVALANDPLELIAVDGAANQSKSNGDAATWLPPNKAFRCQYVARQIAIKAKYSLWVTPAEKAAMVRVLGDCPGQKLPME